MVFAAPPCMTRLKCATAPSPNSSSPHATVAAGQVDKKYIVAKAGGCIVCFDQHAVDERVRLERLERRIKLPLDSAQVQPQAADSDVECDVSTSVAHKLNVHRQVRVCFFSGCCVPGSLYAPLCRCRASNFGGTNAAASPSHVAEFHSSS